jgi:ketosteroid isomerase-like protein
VFDVEVRQDVQERLIGKCRAFEALFKADRIHEMVEQFYAEDAVLEGAELPPRRGRAAIERVFDDARETYSAIRINLDPVIVAGDVAYGGITNINMLDDGTREVHRGVMIWRCVEGSWLVQRDFFFMQRDEFGIEDLLS